MPRPRRKPRPPGNVHVVCTARGTHDPVPFPPRLQLVDDGDRVCIKWDSRQGSAPVTGVVIADGLHTFEYRCPACGRHWKRREDKLVKIAFAFAEFQGISGDDNAPIELDISRVERE